MGLGNNRMNQYIVYRHGCNSANQSMTPVMAIGIWKATTRAVAIVKARREVIVYNNQHLTAKPVSRASKADLIAASEADYARELERKDTHIYGNQRQE